MDNSEDNSSAVFCMHFTESTCSSAVDPPRPPAVVRSITLHSDLNWQAHVMSKVVSRVNKTIQSLPGKITNASILSKVLQSVQSAPISTGNPEFVELFERKDSTKSTKAAYVDDFNCTKQLESRAAIYFAATSDVVPKIDKRTHFAQLIFKDEFI